MISANTVPTFSDKPSLSLQALDQLAATVQAALSAPPTQAPGSAGVRIGRRYAPAHDIPAGSTPIYFSGVAYGPNEYFRPRPGLLQDVGFSSQVDKPVLLQGHALIPLARTVDDYGFPLASPVTGALAGVRTDSGISSAFIGADGCLNLPAAGSGVTTGGVTYFAQFGSGVDTVPGLVQGLTFEDTESPRAYNGIVYFPAAYFDGEQTTRFGAVRSIKCGASSLTQPMISNGDILLPPPSSSVVSPTALAGLLDADGNQVPFSSLGGGGAQRTIIAKQVLTDSAGHSVRVAVSASCESGFLALNLETW